MLYIMRHGLTDWNALQKLQGRTDIPLNADGRAAAERAAKACANTHFDVCFCSPLSRARETAEIVLRGRGVPILPDERLLEMSFGEYEGMIGYFQPSDLPISALFTRPEEYKESVGGAESFEQLFARTGDFLERAAKPLLAQGKDVLIVGHGAMNASIICRVKGIPIEKFWTAWTENCKLTRLL